MGKTGTEKEHLVDVETKNYDSGSVVGIKQDAALTNDWHTNSSNGSGNEETRHLSTFFGVVVPCILSMFSVILFLRMGFIVGQAGLTQSLIILFMAYVIIGLTVLSVCAIATNGAIEGGGAYFMISRALGPEFGGAIGLMFFLANVASAALYVFGIVEAMGAYFGPNGELAKDVVKTGTWYDFGYGSAILFICFVVCLVGANIYAKTTFIIFLVVMISIISVIISFFAKPAHTIYFNHTSELARCNYTSVYYTGFNKTTLDDNMAAEYSYDYNRHRESSFSHSFSVFFTSKHALLTVCTVVMEKVVVGELKNPSKAIPVGTILACLITWFIYLLLMVFIAATTPRDILQCSYTFLVSINVWPPFVVIGIFASSASAVLSQLIGASRILLALAKDELFGIILRPVTKTTKGGNPYVAVLVTWLLVQVVLFARNVNTIAPVVTIFFLFAYAAVDMSCLALEWASAPNFRPTFKYFSWHTCLLGIISCVVMMFLIQAIYTSISIVVLVVLVVVIHYRVPTSSWGYISQALIFHQVRKYLLMLDVRKEHVKFWRPQILLMVKNPRTCCQMIDFINSIKKSGLYVLGHVSPGRLADMPRDILQAQYHHWTNLVEELGVKAFIELTLSTSVREGTEHLLRLSGLGGMKPNTLVLGFYDDSTPKNSFDQMKIFKPVEERVINTETASDTNDSFPPVPRSTSANYFPLIDESTSSSTWMDNKNLQAQEYVEIIADAIKLRKNVCLGRYFYELDKSLITERRQKGEILYIDVWPVNFLHPVLSKYNTKTGSSTFPEPKSPSPFDIGTMSGISVSPTSHFDVTSVFLMQMACILNMTPFWKKNVKLRINLCTEIDSDNQETSIDRQLSEFLKTVRIKAEVRTIPWHNTPLLYSQKGSSGDVSPDIQNEGASGSGVTDTMSGFYPKTFFSGPQDLHASHHVPTIGDDEESISNYLESVNGLIKSNMSDSVVTFLYLPSPPTNETAYQEYLRMLTSTSNGLGPTLFVHGLSHVVSTTL
ncbi:solute carrier family 12 member 9-like isoform X3 [Styela clava]